MMHTGNAHSTTNIHSLKLNGTMEKIVAKLGTYKITKCKPKETNMATSKYGLIQGGDKAFAGAHLFCLFCVHCHTLVICVLTFLRKSPARF